jgi:hypothetical protein
MKRMILVKHIPMVFAALNLGNRKGTWLLAINAVQGEKIGNLDILAILE